MPLDCFKLFVIKKEQFNFALITLLLTYYITINKINPTSNIIKPEIAIPILILFFLLNSISFVYSQKNTSKVLSK